MFRKPSRKETERTQPDHQPMIPVFRKSRDELDASIRDARLRFDEMNPFKEMIWR